MGHDNTIHLTPKLSFALGLVGGILVICTIGFFILLTMVMGDGRPSRAADAGGAGNLVAAPSAVPTAPAAQPAGKLPEISDKDHIRGKGKVTVVEYSDFECPFCSRFHPTMAQLMGEYEGEVRWVYRHFPLSFHPQAMPAANAAECAAEQGKFWEYADKLFENQTALSDTLYEQLAKDLGLNASKFKDCYSTRKYQARITSDQTGGTAAGVTGTPGSIVVAADGTTQLVPGAVPYEQLKAVVDAALAKN